MKKAVPYILYVFIALGAVGIWTKKSYPHQLSVMAIFQNEDRFLKEWIDYHRLQGVEHFYLYNNLSTDDYLEVLQPYLDAGTVELHDWPFAGKPGDQAEWTQVQSAAYRDGLARMQGRTKWAAIIDTDEFILPLSAPNLIEWLASYEDCSGILVNWQVFGTSNVERVPDDGLMIEALFQQAPPEAEINRYRKSIVRPECVKYCNDPHSMVYYPWYCGVDPDKNLLPRKFHTKRGVRVDKIRINHYTMRDEEFLHTHKLARYTKWGMKQQVDSCLEFNRLANSQPDSEIMKYADGLRRLQNQNLQPNERKTR